MSRLTREGTAEPVSRDQILRRERGQRNIHFPCSADHEQDWQPYPVNPPLATCDDHTCVHIHTYYAVAVNISHVNFLCRIAFMTTHTIASEVFRGEFADIRDAYRKEPGNGTILAACDNQILQ